MKNKLIALLCVTAILFSLVALPTLADTGTNTLGVVCRSGESGLFGVTFDLYPVAAADLNGKWKLTDLFDDYPVDIEGYSAKTADELAQTLRGYVLLDGIQADRSVRSTANGSCSFDGLTDGLSLLLGRKFSEVNATYTIQPILVCLPYTDGNASEKQREIVCQPKTYASVNYRLTPEACPREETASVKVLKLWENEDDSHSKRPASVTAILLRDGKPFDRVLLNADNGWSHIFSNLPCYDEEGVPYAWTVVETPVDSYRVSTVATDDGFTVTNTCVTGGEREEPKLPQTGQLWWPVPILAGIGIICIAVGVIVTRRKPNA